MAWSSICATFVFIILLKGNIQFITTEVTTGGGGEGRGGGTNTEVNAPVK